MCFEIWTIILLGFILNLHISLDVVEGEKNEKNWYVSSCNLLIEICISQYFFCYRWQIASRTIYPCQFTHNSVLLHEKFIEMVISIKDTIVKQGPDQAYQISKNPITKMTLQQMMQKRQTFFLIISLLSSQMNLQIIYLKLICMMSKPPLII